MTRGRPRLVEEIFEEALQRPSGEREAFLRSRCGGDGALLSELRVLLECAGIDGGVLDGNAPELLNLPRGETDPGLLPAGTRVGPYTLRSVLGVGGMGVVYLGEQLRPQRTVALKVIRPGFATASVLKRFEYEAELLGRLQHPGIAQIIEAGAAETPFGVQPFFAMELVDGKPLTTHARERAVDQRGRVALMALVCDAVEHAHQRGVVHRDLKPANILVDGSGQPKVLDFGVARAVGGREAEQRLTLMRTGERQLVGTLAYMSPEQVAGDPSAIDTRSDVYALGVVLFELLCGQPPHDLSSRALPEAVRAIRDEDPRALGSIDPACRGDLEIICAKALERAPADRYQSAAQLAEDLRRYLRDAPIEARPRSAVYHLRKFARRNRGLVAGLSIAAAAVVAGAVFGAVQYGHAVTARAQAEERATEADRQRQVANEERDAKMKETENLRRTLAFIQDNVLTQAYIADGDLGRAVSIVDALKSSERFMSRGLAGDPLSEARLRYYAALILQSNNEFDAALASVDRASVLFGETAATPPRERLDADLVRIGLLARMGRFREADALADEALRRPEGATNGNALGMAAYARLEHGDFVGAEPLMRRQFKDALATPNITPLNTYVQTRRLTGLLAAIGRLDEVQAVWDERIAACAARFGGDAQSPTMAFLATAAEQFELAEDAGRALPYRRRANAAVWPDLWLGRPYDAPLRLTANLRMTTGGREEAVREAQAAAERAMTDAAGKGSRTLMAHQAAAEHVRCVIAAGRTDEACRIGEQAMSRLHAETGDWRYRDSDVRQAYAEALLAAGRPHEAADQARAELDRRARLRGWAYPTTWESLRTLTAALAADGRRAEADRLCDDALAEQLESGTMASSATLALAQAVVESLLAAGEREHAAATCDRVLAMPRGDVDAIRRPVIELKCLLARAKGAPAGITELDALERECRERLGGEHPWLKRLAAERARFAESPASTGH